MRDKIVKHCKKVKEKLVYYLDNELKTTERLEVEEHLKECDRCKKVLQELKSISSTFKSLPKKDAPPDIIQEIQPQIDKLFNRQPSFRFLSFRPSYAFGIIIILITIVSASMYYVKYKEKTTMKEFVAKKEKKIEVKIVKVKPKKEEKVIKKIDIAEEKLPVKEIFTEKEKEEKIEPEKPKIAERPEEKKEVEVTIREIEQEKEIPEIEIVKKEEPVGEKEREPEEKEKISPEEKVKLEEEIEPEEEILLEDEIPLEEEVKTAKIKTTPVIIQEKTQEQKESKVNAVWQTPTKAPAEVKPEGKDKKRAILPTAGGTLGFDYKLNKAGDKVQKSLTFARNLNLNWEKPLSKSQSIQMALVRNEQDVTNTKQGLLTGALTYKTSSLQLTINKNLTENETRAPTGNTASKNDAITCNLDIKTFKTLPLNLSYNKTEVSTAQNNNLSSKNITSAFNLTTSTSLFNKITTALTLSKTDTEDLLKTSKTKTDNLGINLAYPMYRFLNLNFGLQKNKSEQLPQDPSARTKTEGINTILGLTSNISEALNIALNLTQSSNKNYTATGVVNTKPTNLTSALNYKLSQSLNLTSSHNLSKTKGGPVTQTLNSSFTFTPSEKLKVLKGAGLNLQQNTSKDKDGNLQNKTNQIGMNTTHQVIKNLDMQTNFNSSQTNSSSGSSKTRTTNFNLNNKLGKNFTQGAVIGITDTSATASSSKTNNYTYNAGYPYTIIIGKKQIPVNISSTITTSSVKPQHTKNTNKTVNFSAQYPVSPSVQTTYALSKTNNLSKTNGSGNATNSTLNNTLGLTFKTGKIPTFGASLNLCLADSNAGSTYTTNATLNYSYKFFERINWNWNMVYSETKQQGKRTPNYVFTTGLGYEY